MVQINQKWNCFANCKYNFSKQAGAMHALLNDDKKNESTKWQWIQHKVIMTKLVVEILYQSVAETLQHKYRTKTSTYELACYIMNAMPGWLRPYNEEPSGACRGETDLEET